MNNEYGVVEEKDTGRRIKRNGAEWPITHQLSRAAHGWTVTDSACGGDASLAQHSHYDTESAAREAFGALPGEV